MNLKFKTMEKKEIIEEEIVIVGGGIAGLATAVALKRVGLHSRVLESHSELRNTGLAIALFPNAWLALRALGVHHKLTSVYQKPDKSFLTNLETGATQDLGRNRPMAKGGGTLTVHRKALLQALAEELPSDTIRFSSKLLAIKTEDSSQIKTLHLADGTIIKAKVVIGCDGVHSTVAQWLGLSQPIHSGRAAFRGLSVFPEGHEFEGVRQYIGLGIKAAFISLNSKELHWFLLHHSSSSSLNADIPTSSELMLKEVTENIAKNFPSDFLTVVRKTDPSTIKWAPLLFRVPWNVAFGRIQNGNVTLAGDAMHPMVPDIGQGGCSALEDAVILARCLSSARDATNNGLEWPEMGLKRYAKERRWRVTWLIAGSWLLGWAQQGGGTVLGWFRDRFFYQFVFPWILKYATGFDSGDLIHLSEPSQQ